MQTPGRTLVSNRQELIVGLTASLVGIASFGFFFLPPGLAQAARAVIGA